MPIEYPGRLLIPQDDVERAQVLEIPLNPATTNGPDILCIYTGTTTKALKGESSGHWSRAKLYVELPTESRKWTDDASRGDGWTLFRDETAMAAPGSLYNKEVAYYAGWAVDAAWLEIMPKREFRDEYLQLRGLVAVRDSDGWLYRISYQAMVLGRILSYAIHP